MQTIVFDFFGVICSEVAPFVLPKYMTEEDAVRYKATIVQDADLGFITQTEMFEKLAEIARAPAEQLENEFRSYVKIDPETVALIEALRNKYRVALLTNAIIPFVWQIMERHDLKRLFETILVSAEEHLAKPDPIFYSRLLDKMGIKAEDAVFLDDNPANIAGAEKVGMKGILFTSAAQARRELKERFGVE